MNRSLILLPSVGAFLSILVACGGEAIPPTAESCAAICAASGSTPAPTPGAAPAPAAAPAAAPAPAGGGMTPYEEEVLGPIVKDLRDGVRPFDGQGVGICRGKDKCDSFIGLSAPDLPPGDYILQAILAVPKSGEGWKITLATECTTEKDGNKSTNQNTKDYDVKYPGPDRGYSLVPLRRIESPGKSGKQSCTWKITAPHPDGDKVYEGSWNTMN